MNLEPLLAVEGMGFSYSRRPIFDGLNMEVAEGEFLGLVGPNGSGKTTLLKIISGVLSQYKGSLRIKNREANRLIPRDRARLVATVQQNPAVPPGFTTLDVVLMGRNPYLGLFQWEGRGDIELCRSAMEMTTSLEFVGRPVSTLSGGELQRVFIARALAQQAPLLLLDEPTAHLDIGFQSSVMDVVQSIRRDARITVLAAMHDLSLAAQYCDRIAVLHKGQILTIGKPDEVITSEVISTAFGAEVSVLRHPVYQTPVVLPMSGNILAKPSIK